MSRFAWPGRSAEKPGAADGRLTSPHPGVPIEAQSRFALRTRHLDEIWVAAQRIRSEYLRRCVARQ
jgi:hypothetical protein